MSTRFKPVSSQVDFNALEGETLQYWAENRTFEKSVNSRRGNRRFIFYEGPPTANGKPHMGHVLQRSLKDLVLRFWTMKGLLVERRAGWDTHGLPVEIEVEKELNLKGKQDILALKENYFESVRFFNEKCKESVFRYVDDWVSLTQRIGFWINFEDAYVTYRNDYIESVWWFLSQVYSRGLLYKDYKVVPYCPRCETSLSSHEVAQGYKDNVVDPSVFIKFELVDEPGTYLLVWTTTPWTLPGNVALAVGGSVEYVKVEQESSKYVLAKKRMGVLEGEYKVIEEVKPKDLIGKSYKPVFVYFNADKKSHYVAAADFATEEEGTGIVHIAVMYGVGDFELGKKLDLPFRHTVDIHGRIMPEVERFAGMFVKDADKEIIGDLQSRGLLYKAETTKHTYPFCWRCATPLLYYALDAWFIKTTAVKEMLLEDNQKINWVPKTIKTGRMKNWLETLVDWNISRNRFWGTPLPIWVCENNHLRVVGSRKEIEELGGIVPNDLHKPYIDEVVLKCPGCGQEMKRVPDVADVWMDSGAMPYAQWHYPFENEEVFKEWFPADYIVEGIDQTRGWFFTLMAEAMLLGERPPAPFKNVVSTGLILDEKGQKMSKSRGNVVDPWDVLPLTGADTLRWYMYTGAPAGGNYLFSKEIVQEKYRRFTLILWNSYKFFVDYAILADWGPKVAQEVKNPGILDRWILAKLNQLVGDVNGFLEKYDAMNASRVIENFVVNDLSTWYIRRSRDRVGPAAERKDWQVFLATLYKVLVTSCKLLAPFMPFVSEEVYRSLTGEESVHLSDFPEAQAELVDKKLILDMESVRSIVEMGHAKRKDVGIKLRQPLAKLIYGENFQKLSPEMEQIMADELNVKIVEYKSSSVLNLDTKITPELRAEGEARELVRQIQSLRKEMGLTLKDKIKVTAPNVPEKEEFVRMVTRQTNASEISGGKELSIEVVK